MRVHYLTEEVVSNAAGVVSYQVTMCGVSAWRVRNRVSINVSEVTCVNCCRTLDRVRDYLAYQKAVRCLHS